ncbi:enoyl-CoA hydratase-related protein [Alteribacter populi]|uniref:enoyl-CoA hydratase-related protein n=1 Tax=Alteribacter populi TaxID=2011011 RepID=UPI000BBAAB1E|nr:enoyl-CoA hydratase-related protein [Alteribacter populi]
MSYLEISKENGVVWIKINRPEAANALSKDVLIELTNQLEELATDRSIRALVITGAGDKVFSAGADLKERRGLSPEEVPQAVKRIRDTVNTVENFPAPTIAAINGSVFGGGLELALACDLRVAVNYATFALTETTLAIIPGAGGTQRLPRTIGMPRAKEMIFTGEKIDAQTAEQWGLVNRVCESTSLLTEVEALTSKMAGNGPVALRQAKYAMDLGAQTDLNSGLTIEEKAYEVTIPTKDRTEGLEAFKEKRKPQYTGE